VRIAADMEENLRFVLESGGEAASNFASDWKSIHALVLGNLADSWRQYINYLDMMVTELVSCGEDLFVRY